MSKFLRFLALNGFHKFVLKSKRWKTDDEIYVALKKGLIGDNGIPLKCHKCGSKNMIDTNYFYLDGHITLEYDRNCNDCEQTLGHWAYGSWECQF